jgi:hypothetical protein
VQRDAAIKHHAEEQFKWEQGKDEAELEAAAQLTGESTPKKQKKTASCFRASPSKKQSPSKNNSAEISAVCSKPLNLTRDCSFGDAHKMKISTDPPVLRKLQSMSLEELGILKDLTTAGPDKYLPKTSLQEGRQNTFGPEEARLRSVDVMEPDLLKVLSFASVTSSDVERIVETALSEYDWETAAASYERSDDDDDTHHFMAVPVLKEGGSEHFDESGCHFPPARGKLEDKK